MRLIEKINNKLIFFINNSGDEVLKKFVTGFYHLSSKEVCTQYNFNIDLIDAKKLEIKVVDFLNKVTSIEEEVKESIPSEEMAFFLTHIAHMYASLIMIEQSLLFYKESIRIREKCFGEKHLSIAENYQSMADVHMQESFCTKALKYYKKSLEIRVELSYVENNLLVSDSYSRLALAYYHLEQYTMALGYIEDSIKIREKLLPSGDIRLENSYYNYKFILKACEPKKDYLKIFFHFIHRSFSYLIKHLVGQK